MIPSAFMNTQISLIMVDMGGVLALHTDSTMEYSLLQEFGLGQYRNFSELDPSLPLLLQEHSKSVIDEQEMWRLFTEKTHIEVPSYEISLWGKYFCPTLDKAMVNLLRELKEKGYRIICATNTEPAHYAYHRKHNQYALFDAVYASCVMGHAKPERAFFAHILECEQVTGGQVFFIDDYLENCNAASEVSINVHHFQDAVTLRQTLNSMGIL